MLKEQSEREGDGIKGELIEKRKLVDRLKDDVSLLTDENDKFKSK